MAQRQQQDNSNKNNNSNSNNDSASESTQNDNSRQRTMENKRTNRDGRGFRMGSSDHDAISSYDELACQIRHGTGDAI